MSTNKIECKDRQQPEKRIVVVPLVLETEDEDIKMEFRKMKRRLDVLGVRWEMGRCDRWHAS
jgi:hypothetical protein